jgi:hypothetical protein
MALPDRRGAVDDLAGLGVETLHDVVSVDQRRRLLQGRTNHLLIGLGRKLADVDEPTLLERVEQSTDIVRLLGEVQGQGDDFETCSNSGVTRIQTCPGVPRGSTT